MWSAMPRRIALIGSRISPSWAVTGAEGAAGAGAGGAAAAGAGAGVGAGAGASTGSASMKARMSFFVTRPPRPVPGTDCGSIAVLGGDPRDDRRDEGMIIVVAVPARRGSGRRLRRLRAAGCVARGRRVGDGLLRRSRLVPGSLVGGRALLGGRCGRRGALGRDHRDTRADGHRLALVHEDLLDDAGAGTRDLGVDLVGRDLEKRLVGLDRIALVLDPADDRALRDGHAHLGHHDVDTGFGRHQ